MVYALTERGRKELRASGKPTFPAVPRLRNTASALRMGHDLRVSDVLVALQVAGQRTNHQLHLHHHWARDEKAESDNQFRPLSWRIRIKDGDDPRRARMIPDAGFSISDENGAQSFFALEVDRGTMPATRSNPAQTSFTRKVQAYRETREAGILWKRWNVPGFRVLVVCESRQRMVSLQRATADCFRYGRSTMFLFAVADELIASPDPLWGPWQNCTGEPAVLMAKPASKNPACQDPAGAVT